MACSRYLVSTLIFTLFSIFAIRYFVYDNNSSLIPLHPSSTEAVSQDSPPVTMSGMKSVAYFVNWVSSFFSNSNNDPFYIVTPRCW